MRSILTITILFFFSFSYGQIDSFFTGKIIYSQEFVNPVSGDNITSEMKAHFGSEQHYFVNETNYKAYNELGELKQLYNGGSANKYYFVNPQTKDVMRLDATEVTSRIVSIENLEEIEEVMNLKCNMIKIVTDTDETTYWYNSSIRVPMENFTGHLFGHWALYLKNTNGALPLKYLTKSSSYHMESTAISIQEMPLTDSDFDIQLMLSKE